MMDIPYQLALYRRNSSGEPYVWYCSKFDNETVQVQHGTVGGKIVKEFYKTHRDVDKEVKSRINAKLKTGYKPIQEIRDSNTRPVEEDIMSIRAWLDTYLPINRTTSEGIILPMLAKAYDNKVFDRCSSYIGQWKINGLRCLVKVVKNTGDLFKPFSLQFQSREGEIWNSLPTLEDYLLHVIPQDILVELYQNNISLDGEVYLPGGYDINQINHFVKDPTCVENKALQFWCYDIAVEDMLQYNRNNFILNKFHNNIKTFTNKDSHYNNKERFIILPTYEIGDDYEAKSARNYFIDLGFEGLILRNPNVEYDFGKRRVGVMVKYKKARDGVFTVVDIKPEGTKRADIPLLVCKNDINDELFECHLSKPLEYQRKVLHLKNNYIGKQVNIEFTERSGIAKVPFHIKEVHFI